MIDLTRERDFEGASGLVSASPENDLGQVWKGLKWTAISPKSRTSGNAFASQRLRYFLMAGSISSGKVEGSRDAVQG
jgi:hypothetical protein